MDLAAANEKIEMVMDTVPLRIEGKFAVETLELENVKTKETRSLPVRGIFVAVGQQPSSDLVKGLVETNAAGYIVAGEDCKTNVPGVYVAGDIRTKDVRQIVTAAADGAVAAYGIELGLL